jgi:Ca-activated chloride channel family protein
MDQRNEPAFTLRASDPDTPPVLEGVSASGRLDGVLFTTTLRQTYCNPGTRPLELLYTFPLPAQAVLLGFAAEFGDRRVDGQVMARQQAERVYEDALADGDAPALLEVAGDGLHTASLGNLLPGEQVVLEVRFAQLLAFEQGRLRLVVPTTIAPRYCSAETAGVAAHQVPAVSLTAEYPLALEVTVTGSLAAGRIECPTHAHALERTGAGTRLALAEGARLDRDVVLIVTPAEPRPDLLVTSRDGRDGDGKVVALAAFELPPAPARERISLALLVDGSGSMGGDGIASARRALHGVAEALGAQDEVSFSRFGSRVEHALKPSPCASAVRNQLRRLVDATDATLGGTEMAQALNAVFGLWPEGHGVDVLLITDGEIWHVDKLLAAARKGGHRVFAIGVGSAPAEGVLRRLAEATGGACEFATPGEALEAAAVRMLGRIRQVPHAGVRVDWGVAPAWEVPVPAGVFGGDTVVAWAGFDRELGERASARLLAGNGDGGERHERGDDRAQRGGGALATETELVRTCVTVPTEGTDLARMAASRRLAIVDEAQALQLALDHQLVTDRTHCVLVHRRADADKPAEDAELHRVQSMLAAGWGGMGRAHALQSRSMSFDMPESLSMSITSTPSVWRSGRAASAKVEALMSSGMDEVEIPAFLRKQDAEEPRMTLADIAQGVADYVRRGGDLAGLAAHCGRWPLPARVRALVEALVTQGMDEAQAWLLLADWIAGRPGRDGDAALQAILAPLVKTVEQARKEQAWKAMERALGTSPVDSWVSTRARRLRRALQP